MPATALQPMNSFSSVFHRQPKVYQDNQSKHVLKRGFSLSKGSLWNKFSKGKNLCQDEMNNTVTKIITSKSISNLWFSVCTAKTIIILLLNNKNLKY